MSLAPGLYIHNIAELDGGNEPWRPASTATAGGTAEWASDCPRWRVVGLPPLEGRRTAPDGGSSVCHRSRVVGLPPMAGRRTAHAGGSSDRQRWRGIGLGRKGVPRGSGLETVDESGAARSRVDKVGPCPVGSSPCPQPWRSRSSRPRKPELRA